ncbi:unnamed protein product [Cyclocybe aegerita]|uniref:Uncharacterized protein n=1 Tax=Cyclocybe aegerita TaxID=1973307 RepID=A0A8S0WD98_CYCAE|nr:unnamed protein product [Cyclocybe aegerita]
MSSITTNEEEEKRLIWELEERRITVQKWERDIANIELLDGKYPKPALFNSFIYLKRDNIVGHESVVLSSTDVRRARAVAERSFSGIVLVEYVQKVQDPIEREQAERIRQGVDDAFIAAVNEVNGMEPATSGFSCSVVSDISELPSSSGSNPLDYSKSSTSILPAVATARHPALDTVKIISKSETAWARANEGKVVKTIRVPNGVPSGVVARLLVAIAEEKPTYSITGAQCYYLTGTFMRLLERLYPDAEVVDGEAAARDRLARERAPYEELESIRAERDKLKQQARNEDLRIAETIGEMQQAHETEIANVNARMEELLREAQQRHEREMESLKAHVDRLTHEMQQPRRDG